jgi:hypothetical protein
MTLNMKTIVQSKNLKQDRGNYKIVIGNILMHSPFKGDISLKPKAQHKCGEYVKCRKSKKRKIEKGNDNLKKHYHIIISTLNSHFTSSLLSRIRHTSFRL